MLHDINSCPNPDFHYLNHTHCEQNNNQFSNLNYYDQDKAFQYEINNAIEVSSCTCIKSSEKCFRNLLLIILF